MAIKWRLFTLLMWKNFTVRKRHWKVSLLVEILIPVLLFTLIQVVRDFVDVGGLSDTEIQFNDTIFPIQSREEILKIANDLNPSIYFIPKNNYTQYLMDKTRNCLGLPRESRFQT